MYKYKSKKKQVVYILAIIIIAILLYILYVLTRFETVLTTEGYVRMELDGIVSAMDRYVVILKGECTELNFFISPDQALAIQEGSYEEVKPRPMTHDILVDILEGFEIKPVMIKITSLSDNTYFAELTLREWNRFLIVDIRPSDGIATAVRTNTPIYVNEELVMKTC